LCQFNALAGKNLVINGSFDDLEDPLKGWTHNYGFTGNTFYRDNHKYVSVIPRDGTRSNVLRLHGTFKLLWASGQGVKVDSKPIPFEQGARYKLSVRARSPEGANARIYIEGYKWKPGIRPHSDPQLYELQRIYKQGAGHMLYLTGKNSRSAKKSVKKSAKKSRKGPTGVFSNPTRNWKQGACVFPAKNLSNLGKKHLKKVRFMVVHMIAINCPVKESFEGDILVDDVVLERIN